jgi:hypothetical protein
VLLSTEEFQANLRSIIDEWNKMEVPLAADGNFAPVNFWKKGRNNFDPNKWREFHDARRVEREAAIVEFDKRYLKDLRKCLFALRTPPFNEQLDKAIARGANSEWLIRFYSHMSRFKFPPSKI